MNLALKPASSKLVDLLNDANSSVVHKAIESIFKRTLDGIPDGRGQFNTPDETDELIDALRQVFKPQ